MPIVNKRKVRVQLLAHATVELTVTVDADLNYIHKHDLSEKDRERAIAKAAKAASWSIERVIDQAEDA